MPRVINKKSKNQRNKNLKSNKKLKINIKRKTNNVKNKKK